MGLIFATFHLAGTKVFSNDALKIILRILEQLFEHSMRTCGWILSVPIDLDLSSFFNSFSTFNDEKGPDYIQDGAPLEY